MAIMRNEQSRFIIFLLSPTFFVFIILSIYPFIEAIRCSLTNENILHPGISEFVGLTNYIRLFSDYRFINAIKVSLVFFMLATILSFLGGLLLSLILYKEKGKIMDITSVIFLLPALSSRVAISLIWRWMYQPSVGVINYFMELVGLPHIPWLTDVNIALFSLIIVDVWQWAPFICLLIISSIKSIPADSLEAAEVDGASELQIFRQIIFPLLAPTFISIIFLKSLLSLRTFDLMWNMTRGGPGISTQPIDMYAYLQGIQYGGEISYASAIAIVTLFATEIFMSLVMKVSARWQQRK